VPSVVPWKGLYTPGVATSLSLPRMKTKLLRLPGFQLLFQLSFNWLGLISMAAQSSKVTLCSLPLYIYGLRINYVLIVTVYAYDSQSDSQSAHLE
jgi:hypothetical protein